MVIITSIERETLLFFLHISQTLTVPTFGNTADVYAIVHLVPHACQHITVEPNHSSGDTVAKILTFTERHFWYYCLLAANQVNYVHGLFLEQTWRVFLSIFL
jgi:hypothetical protein